jgi:hypothetical protein
VSEENSNVISVSSEYDTLPHPALKKKTTNTNDPKKLSRARVCIEKIGAAFMDIVGGTSDKDAQDS